ILSRAPGVLKLFGEHAVVYGKKCAAITINRFAIAKIQKYKKDLIAIYLKDKNQTIKLLKKAFAKMNFLKRSSQEIKFAKFSSKVAKVLSN
ncbi:MAG: hypothetical protein QXP35_02320, partial [Candidatus Micrarchaeaceae archaeon]